jgi:hypothetical protein
MEAIRLFIFLEFSRQSNDLRTFKNTPNDGQFGRRGMKITSFWSDEPEDKDESMRPRSSRGPRIFCMCFQVPSWKLHWSSVLDSSAYTELQFHHCLR